MIQNINLGASPNDKTGTKARVAGQMINANFAYLEAKIDNKSYIKVETGFTLVAQDLTFNADWEWMINNIDYTNPSSVVINIPFAASGKSRIDLIVCNTSNTFNRVAGVESVSTPVAPALPINTVMATFFTVTDGTISTPSVPSTGGAVDSVNGMTGAVALNQDGIPDGTTYKRYSLTEKNKLASITEIFTTALKSSYDGAVSALTTLLSTGSRLITTTEITKLSNTSGTNTGDQDLIFPVTETGTSFSLTDAHNGKITILTASCTVTIPNGLLAGFEHTIVTLAGVTLTIALGGSVTLFNNSGTTMAEKLSCTIKNRTATNQYITAGNL